MHGELVLEIADRQVTQGGMPVTLNAAVYNLLNKDFIDYQPYRAPALTYANRYVNSMDGRRLWLSASVDF